MTNEKQPAPTTEPSTTSEQEAEHERKEIRKGIDETEAPTRIEIKEPKKATRPVESSER